MKIIPFFQLKAKILDLILGEKIQNGIFFGISVIQQMYLDLYIDDLGFCNVQNLMMDARSIYCFQY